MILISLLLSLNCLQILLGSDPGPYDIDPNYIYIPKLPLREYGIHCSPRRLHPGDVLQIDLPAKHGTDMAVVNGKGDYLFLTSSDPTPEAKPGPMTDGRLAHMRRYVARVDTLRGHIGENGHPEVFTRAGVYDVQVAETLETEDPILDGACTVTYTPHLRKLRHRPAP